MCTQWLCVGFSLSPYLWLLTMTFLVLNLDIKMSYFEKNWDPELQKVVLSSAEEMYVYFISENRNIN